MNKQDRRKVMFDGLRAGAKLIESSMRGSVGINAKEATAIRRIMEICGAEPNGKDLELNVTNKSTMKMVLRQDRVNKHAWYLNLSGNPLTFFTNSNVYGWPEADTLILDSFKHCITYAQKKARLYFPQRVRTAIQDLDIHLSSLEFASYTNPMKNKDLVMNAWDYMYRTTNSFDGRRHQGLERLLNVVRINNEYDDSFCLALLDNNKRKELYFMVYDKEKELQNQGLKVPADIRNRLRCEINLTSWWLNRRRFNVVRDLKNHVDRKWGSDWGAFVLSKIQEAINRTCLYHMFEFPEDDIVNGRYEAGKPCLHLRADIPYEAYLGMLHARAHFWDTNEDRLTILKGGRRSKRLNLKPMTIQMLSGLELDGGFVNG